ncbi:MAG: SelB C-terminal domain-containing protein, partial [Clostridia bacterium]|nr:SelB C-terminal domain-containing protein [Clostridia bacterium]
WSDLVSLFQFRAEPSPKDKIRLDTLTELYRSSWFQPPSVKDALEKAGAESGRRDELFNYLQSSEILVKISEELYFHSEAYGEALKLLRQHFAGKDELTLAQFRDITGSSRKYVQALLEHFDQARLTRRVEDYRVPLKLNREVEGR